MSTPARFLDIAYKQAVNSLQVPLIENPAIRERVEYICRNIRNRACVRVLLSALLAKLDKPDIDVRKPYTRIGTDDCYSGRVYDERYIGPFITKHNLPCNSTTAFLTPAFRNRDIVLTPKIDLVGNVPQLYEKTLKLLTDVHQKKVSVKKLLAETIRCLLVVRDEKNQRIETLLAGLKTSTDTRPLASEGIVTLIQQHLQCPKSSRLPVLIVAAVYQTIESYLGERVLPLQGHNAADEQTGALGDLEITLIDDDNVVTSYEMKMKRVTQPDIDRALQKITNSKKKIDNYIFITTDVVDYEVQEYAASIYAKTGGIEIVILDCISFLRHFLHLFHRLRLQFLETYQSLLLDEPESAVSHALKEAFLALRHAAESSE